MTLQLHIMINCALSNSKEFIETLVFSGIPLSSQASAAVWPSNLECVVTYQVRARPLFWGMTEC